MGVLTFYQSGMHQCDFCESKLVYRSNFDYLFHGFMPMTISSDQLGIYQLINFLQSHFQRKNINKLIYLLCFNLVRSKGGNGISFGNYALDLLESRMLKIQPVESTESFSKFTKQSVLSDSHYGAPSVS